MVRKKNKKKNLTSQNQRSFFFEDYIKTNQKYKDDKNVFISNDRIYLLFFLFVSLIIIFSLKITLISFQTNNYVEKKKSYSNFLPLRKDIVDRNGIIISRNIQTFHAAIKPKLIKDKKKFLVKLKLAFPEMEFSRISKKLYENNYFYLKKRLNDQEREILWKLGEKGIIFEPFQTRVYPHSELYSHIIGQVDYDNYGISGVERYYDDQLIDLKELNKPLQLSLDTNLQFIIKSELAKSSKIFKAKGAAALLMNANDGEILSLVSLPDYDINKRIKISDKKFMNKITKGVFELGSIFKTFTVALALDENLVKSKTLIKNIPQKINCSIYEISDIKKFPNIMSVEDILIQSSNIGTIKIAKKIGEEKYKKFLKKINVLDPPNIELDEKGIPISFNWNKCKLETISYGHGITTTPLQATTAYASLINGGLLIEPTLEKNKNSSKIWNRIITEKTSSQLRKILRKVVTDEKGTASLADIYGYNVSGKTGTSQYYNDKNKNINTFISFFSSGGNTFVLSVIFDDPKTAKDLTYDYRGIKIKGTRNEAGWNSVYTTGKIIEKIGPILAINNYDEYSNHVVKKIN